MSSSLNQLEIVVAHSANLVIGKDGTMPWPHNKPDMKHFKELTMGQLCVAGTKTFDSLPPLDGRIVIKLSRNGENSFEQILKAAEAKRILIIGGGEIYKLFLPYATILHVSRIKGEYEGDTFFPEYRTGDFECVNEIKKPSVSFLTYIRSKNKVMF